MENVIRTDQGVGRPRQRWTNTITKDTRVMDQTIQIDDT